MDLTKQFDGGKKSIMQGKASGLIAILLIVFSCGKLSAQNDIGIIQTNFENYRKQTLQEKLFVHTDKNFYLAGEILWLKVYDVDAFFHRPLSVSTVAYIELLNNENQPALQTKISLEKGHGNGSVYIPITLASGVYKLRAYTAWMKNFPATYYFEKTIKVVNTRDGAPEAAEPIAPPARIHFFPEGGDLVNSIQSRVAFHLTDNHGKGMAGKGIIKDEAGNTVASIETFHFGMGSFLFTPETGKKYKAFVTVRDSITLEQELPASQQNGYVMHLADQSPEALVITVQATNNTGNESADVYLFAHTRHAIKSVQKTILQNGTAGFTIAKNLLGDGISQLTVFNNKRQPVCERLYFTFPTKDLLRLQMTADQPVYGTRKKISLQVNAETFDGQPSPADMSLAVYRLDALQVKDESSIANYLLLTSDLPGYIEDPEFYFLPGNKDAAATAMDNLVLSQGWRRFAWRDVLENRPPVFQFEPEINGHLIHGKMVDNSSGKPVANKTAWLTVPGVQTLFRPALSDSLGKIRFEMRNFFGSPGIIVQTAPQDSLFHTEINSPFSTDYSPSVLPEFSLSEENKELLLDKSISAQVQNIYMDSLLHRFVYSFPDTLPFYRYANETYVLDNYTRFTTVEEIFREYVPYVNVRFRNNRFHLPVFDDAVQNGPFREDPLVLLDGLPVSNLNKVMSYDALKIRKIDLVTRRYFYGNDIYSGILNFVTYKGDLDGFPLDPSSTVIDYEALQLQREFFSPAYSTAEAVDRHLPDFREVLYWSPNVGADKTGKASLNFYSSDIPGKYVGILQALSPTGACGTTSVSFEVK